MSRIGKRLSEESSSENNSTLVEIDYTVLQSLLGKSNAHEACVALRVYLESKINARQR
jgi:hypothetical protein